MAYDVKPVRAPRLTGRSLRTFANWIERAEAGRAVRATLMAQLGLKQLRAADPGTHSPHRGPLPHRPDDEVEQSVSERMATAVACSEPEGFAYPTTQDYGEAYEQERTTPTQVARRFLEGVARSDEGDKPLRTFIAYRADDLLAQARASTERWQSGRALGPLDGVPVAVKDEVDVRGYGTTAGTAIHGKRPAERDCTPVALLRAQGALILGKTNMHELGSGVTGVNPHHGAARNPYDPDHITGGSSSGTAAAVAAGFCPIAVACDGGGSIRMPASFCGVTGLKATFGRISGDGAAPLVWSVAHTGPLACSATDAALAYAVMAGPDPRDPETLSQPGVHLTGFGADDLRGVRLGLFEPWFEDADPEVVSTCRDMLDGLVERGAEIVPVVLPDLQLMRLVHLVTIGVEMATGQAPFYAKNRRRYGYEARIAQALMRRVQAIDYLHAQRLRTRLTHQWLEAMAGVDGVVTPATGSTAHTITGDELRYGVSDASAADRIMRFAPPANLTGFPAISFLAGHDSAGLPVGLQVMGRPWQEHTLLRVAQVAEQLVTRRRPKVFFDLLGG